ncbi:MAG TPA: hypothetical protein VGJ77_14105 [Gaiellaceae bacterium]|jgi:hypothetical protein
MSTVTDFQDLAQKGQEQYLAAIRESQQAVVDAVGAWSQTVQGLTAAVPPVPGVDQLPSAEAVIDNTFDLVEKLIAGQREFARNLLAAASPAAPAKPAAAPKK